MVPLSFREISERLRNTDLPAIDIVIGIGSGGIVPASIVAFHLKAELKLMILNYRDPQNRPIYDEPVILHEPEWDLEGKRVLVVDDVSVTGKTMNKALEQLKGYNVKTLAMKGKADYVLFPEIKDCVQWPWKP